MTAKPETRRKFGILAFNKITDTCLKGLGAGSRSRRLKLGNPHCEPVCWDLPAAQVASEKITGACWKGLGAGFSSQCTIRKLVLGILQALCILPIICRMAYSLMEVSQEDSR